MFRHSLRVGLGGTSHRDAMTAQAPDVHIVEAGAVLRHDAQPGRAGQHLREQPRRSPSNAIRFRQDRSKSGLPGNAPIRLASA